MVWYKNSSVWSVIVASIAILLSQFPPIQDWLPKTDLQIQYGDGIGLNNAIGLIGYHVNLELDNDGNTTLEVEDIILKVKEPSGKTKTYIAETLSTPTQVGGYFNLPVTSLELKPNESWSGTVFFNRNISPSEEENWNRIRLKVAQNISDQIQSQQWGEYNPRALVVVEPDVEKLAVQFFNEKFDLQKGLHETTIEVKLRNTEDQIMTHFEFTLYEYHFEMVKAQVADYKYGWGVYLPHAQNKQIYIKIRPNKAN